MEVLLNSLLTTMPMLVCGFWSIVLFYQYKNSNRAKRILSWFMLTATVLYFAHCVFFNRAYAMVPFTDTLYSASTVAVYPLYFLYILALTDTKRFSLKTYIILTPALLLGICIGTLYLFMSSEQITVFMNEYLYAISNNHSSEWLVVLQKRLHDLVKLAFAVQIVPILWCGMKKLSGYNKHVASCFSNTENKTLLSTRSLLIFFVITSLVSFVVNIIGRECFTDSIVLMAIPSIIYSILLFCIGYVGFNQNFTAIDLYIEYDNKDIVNNNINDSTQLKNKIINLVRDEKLYLQPDLKLSDIAIRVGTNKTYIYNAINIDMQVSFSEFINRQRIAYSQELMKANAKTTMIEILNDSGFTSEASFYRNFKQFAGLTPQKWRVKFGLKTDDSGLK